MTAALLTSKDTSRRFRIFQKRIEFENSLDPYQVPENEWVDNVAVWPLVEFGSIYSCLIDSTQEFTKEKLKVYKSLEVDNYYSR